MEERNARLSNIPDFVTVVAMKPGRYTNWIVSDLRRSMTFNAPGSAIHSRQSLAVPTTGSPTAFGSRLSVLRSPQRQLRQPDNLTSYAVDYVTDPAESDSIYGVVRNQISCSIHGERLTLTILTGRSGSGKTYITKSRIKTINLKIKHL